MEIILSIMAFCFVTSITPGPNNIMLLASGLNHGPRKTLPHLLGVILGFPAMVGCIGLGLGSVFFNYPIIHHIVKTLGIVYLLFLAWKIANAGNTSADAHIREPMTFLQALAFQWVNPKAWVMAIGGVAAFTTAGNMVAPVVTIILGYLTIGSFCMVLWLMLGASLQKLLQSERQLRYFNLTMALLLVGSVIPIAIVELSSLQM